MTDDLRDGLDREFDRYTPRIDISVDDMIHKGRRRVRRRRFGIAGAATGGVATIAAIALLAPSLFSATTTATDGAAENGKKNGGSMFQEPGEFPVALEPDTLYRWVSTEIWAENEEDVYTVPDGADEVAAELWSRLDAVGYRYDPWSRENAELTRHPEVLIEDPDQAPLHDPESDGPIEPEDALFERAVYGMQVSSEMIDGMSTGTLTLDYYPAGTYLKGAATAEKYPHWPDARYLVAGCDPVTHEDWVWGSGDEVTAEFECSESTGPNGEQVLTVVQTVDYGAAKTQDRTTVVVYHEDGSATMFREDAVPPATRPASPSDVEGSELKLTPEQLRDVVLALPPIEVK